MNEYCERLLRMIEKAEERLAQLRKKKESHIPALIAECERELEVLREELRENLNKEGEG